MTRPLLGVGALVVVVAALWWWLSAPVQEIDAPAVVLAPVPTAPTATTVLVDVIGAVRRPGVVRLPAGARVVDAVTAAGGLLPHRRAVVNMARVVVDGEQIVVGTPPAPVHGEAAGSGRIDLNAADAAALDALPGIGPVLAERIVHYREQHGAFAHINDLLDVPGIGDAKFADLSDLVSAQ